MSTYILKITFNIVSFSYESTVESSFNYVIYYTVPESMRLKNNLQMQDTFRRGNPIK